MPDCRYCGESFDSADARDRHLRDAHPDELGRIDRRRLGMEESSSGPNWGVVVLIVLIAGILGVVVGTIWLGSGGGDGSGEPGSGPNDLWGVHYHGTIEVVVAGDTIDFGQQQYQLQADAFHFENNQGGRWHGHARNVTLRWAMATLGIEVTQNTVSIDGETYRESTQGTTVTVTVNGEPVTPGEYVLKEGDHIRIVVETGA